MVYVRIDLDTYTKRWPSEKVDENPSRKLPNLYVQSVVNEKEKKKQNCGWIEIEKMVQN